MMGNEEPLKSVPVLTKFFRMGAHTRLRAFVNQTVTCFSVMPALRAIPALSCKYMIKDTVGQCAQ